MNLNTTSPDSSVFSIKSASFDALRLLLEQQDLAVLRQALQSKLRDAGAFFDNDPVVVDASLVDQVLDWPAVFDLVRECRLHPIGAIATGTNAEAAQAAGIALLDLRSTQLRQLPEGIGAPAMAASMAPPVSVVDCKGSAATPAPLTDSTAELAVLNAPVERTLLLNRPVRSGQRIYARGGDVVVMGFVSRGAEIIADGNVHVYGPLRGRAIAGARGDARARIFTTHLDAELLAVAGVYRTSENSYPEDVFGRPALVRLVGERLLIEPIVQD